MTSSTIVVMLVGLALPLLTAVITKENISPKWKATILLFLTTTAGVISSFVWPEPTTLQTWEHLVLNIVMAFLSAFAADREIWNPLGTAATVHQLTPRFGFGPAASPPEHAKAA